MQHCLAITAKCTHALHVAPTLRHLFVATGEGAGAVAQDANVAIFNLPNGGS
jgi:hypothetical protein